MRYAIRHSRGVLTVEAKRPLTMAELRAVAKRAKLKGVRSPSLDKLERASEAFHWGRRSRTTKAARVPDPRAGVYVLGRLRRVEYETTKGKERAIWYHDFSAPYPLITGTADGRLGPIVGGRARVTRRGIEG